MAMNRSSMKKEMQGGMESPKENAADRRAGIAENSRKDTAMDTKQARGSRTNFGEGGGVGVVRPGSVANKAPGAMKMSPHKKLAAGAKGIVKGK